MTDLPPDIEKVLTGFLDQARLALGPRLQSAVLYGSAAEGRLRPTSDVNLLLVLSEFIADEAQSLGSILEFSRAAIDLQVMFLLEKEIPTASELFAVKFLDISRRRKVLLGIDPFAGLEISRPALIARLRQVLLNHLLRLRSAYVSSAKSAHNLMEVLSDSAAPLRAAAGAILELRQQPAENPRDALFQIGRELRDDGYLRALEAISSSREGTSQDGDHLRSAVSEIIELTARMKDLVKQLPA